jgi:probable HAF family extracellular repeat protein
LRNLTPYYYSNAKSINNLGQIVGYSQAADGSRRATLWNNGVATDLNSLLNAEYHYEVEDGWILTEANDINDNGWIVGRATLIDPNDVTNVMYRAFVLNPVPEADTSAMLLMGAGVMGFMARRRKNTQA